MTDRKNRAAELMRFDSQFRTAGIVLAGMDEVGRGPLAGNVVTACVVMPPEPLILWVDDSKKLSEARRDKVYDEIMSAAAYVGIGQVTPAEIDEINILQATHEGMRCVAMELKASFALVDGLKVPRFPVPARFVVKGDATSASIAAASIIAKTTRDCILNELDEKYPQYGFASHKGYGTREHLEALRKYGPCPAHRQTFAPVRAILNPTPTQLELPIS